MSNVTADVSTTDREVPSVPPHPAHVRNNRILIEYKQSGERQQEKVAHGNMEEALCKPPVQSSCRSVRVYSLLPRVSLLSPLSTSLLRLFFPRESVSIPFYPRDPSFLGGSTVYSTYVDDIFRPVLYDVHEF